MMLWLQRSKMFIDFAATNVWRSSGAQCSGLGEYIEPYISLSWAKKLIDRRCYKHSVPPGQRKLNQYEQEVYGYETRN
jgi:hypothetical protein